MQEHRWVISLARTLVLVLCGLSIHQSAHAAGPLRYRPQLEGFAYEVEIVADLPSEVQTLKGTISYEVESADAPLKLKYQGGLNKSVKPKPNSSPSPRGFGPPGMRFHGGPFGRGNSFQGIGRAINQLTLTSRGEVRSMEGSSQLPFLFGNLSILVFEPLPESDKKSWSVKTGVSVAQNSGPSRRMPIFIDNDRKKTTAGSESTSFSLKSTQGDLSTFRKTYKLEVPDDEDKTTISGSGSWVFNRKLGLPESLDCSYRMVVTSDNVTVTIPLTIKYHRLSSEQWAKLEKQRKDEIQAAHDRHKQRLADLNAPIEGDKRRKLLADLRSTNSTHLNAALSMLGMREPGSDEQLAQAIEPLLGHASSSVRRNARRALANVSPEYERKHEVIERYSRSSPVDITGPAVTARTPLPPGLIVALRYHRRWYPATIVGTLDNGQVEVQRQGRSDTKTYSRTDLRLAPPEIDQPNVDAKLLTAAQPDAKRPDAKRPDAKRPDAKQPDAKQFDIESAGGFRVWTDSTGTFALVAKYVDADDTHVRLQRKKDGKEIKVPLERLSETDRKTAENLRNSRDNPFDP